MHSDNLHKPNQIVLSKPNHSHVFLDLHRECTRQSHSQLNQTKYSFPNQIIHKCSWTYTVNVTRPTTTKQNQTFLTKPNLSHVFLDLHRDARVEPQKTQTKYVTKQPQQSQTNCFLPNQILHTCSGPAQRMHLGNLHKPKPNFSYQTK
jgi:hypothetical protein